MKIAITADLHLRSREEYPERFAALENIFFHLQALQIDILIIAGDLQDAQYNNFAEFESLCHRPENRKVRVLIIPGNHDPNIGQGTITTDNIHIFSQPKLVALDSSFPAFLFIPYQEGKTMGDVIASFSDQLHPQRWVLVSHGDWMGNVKAANVYEKGIYMPLSQRDLDTYLPARVFLGHIHTPYDGTLVCYPGSPCGVNITETGRRRFVTYDTLSNSVNLHQVDSQQLFFNRTFTVYPVDNEAAALESLLRAWIDSWGLTPAEKPKARVRVKLNGYATDKQILKQVVLNTLDGYQLHEEPDLSEVSVTADLRRGQILNLVKDKINSLNWPEESDEPNQDQMLLAAIKMVYGG